MNIINRNLRLWEVLSGLAFVVGFVCLFYSYFLDRQSILFAVTLSLGVALLPTGIISIITSLSSSKVVEDNIRQELGETTKELKESIADLKVTSDYLSKSKELGVEMVYENRAKALGPFLKHLEKYIKEGDNSENKEIIFVGSSLKGIKMDVPKYESQLKEILISAKEKKIQCRFLLTHPTFSKLREAQEETPSDGIAFEILHALAWLERDVGIPREDIKLYKGTPTCFMIASTERMIINPYPYEEVAYHSFCLEVKNLESPNSIYGFFKANHFSDPFGDKEENGKSSSHSLHYIYDLLEGPIPLCQNDTKPAFADFFVIKDTGSFYLAINVRGLEKDIPFNQQLDGSRDFINVGKTLAVKLLDLSDNKVNWESVGTIDLKENRDGFWHSTLKDLKSIDAYSMIGVFDEKNDNKFFFKEANSLINGQPLPMLWKWLPINRNDN